jgi:type II secretory pathway pseudopilin PulG
MIEAVMVMLIVVVVIATLTPGVSRQLMHSRVTRAASVCAADFYLAQSLAARNRAPVRVIFDVAAKTASLRLPNDSLLLVRNYGLEGDFKLPSLSASPATVQVLPNGMTNGTITVTLGDGTFTRQVRMSRAGQIRILRS